MPEPLATCARTHKEDSIMIQGTPTDTEASTALVSEDDVLELMEAYGVQTQVVGGEIQALSIWADKYAGGGIGSEWVTIVYRRNWLNAFLGISTT